MQPPLELTLIVAATRSMGIGLQGAMPWKGLKQEMQYFARVTTRLPPPNPSASAPAGAQARNAVIMGRKTWDSIPPKFRPLKNRLNIVVTRSAAPSPLPPSHSSSPPPNGGGGGGGNEEEVRVPSIEAAVQYAQACAAGGRIFVMGGAQIYDAALRLPAARRVLLTSIDHEFQCDTLFPLDLTGGKALGWERRSRERLQEWTGEEEVAEGGQEEAGIKYEFQMWEKVN